MVAFVFSIIVTTAISLIVVPMAKRRPVGTALTWGEAMLAAAFVFGVLFLAYGVVPHQWLSWADNELKWRPDKLLFGPGHIFKPKALGGFWPFTMNYRHLRDVIAAGLYGIFLGSHIFVWSWWQKRDKTTSTEVVVSSYGRPLAKKV